MENIVNEYEQMITKLFTDKDKYNEEDVVIFTPVKGTSYNTELMVVGRAVNDWGNKINKGTKPNVSKVLKGIVRDLEWEDLQWVYDDWGTKQKDTYNPAKSAFWRVVRALSHQFVGDEQADISLHTIVWSNLYKVAKDGGGNPSARLKSVQFEHCLNLLKSEIEIFKPQYVVFLTDYYGWAEPFIKGLGMTKKSRSDKGFVRFTGTYNGSNIVVAQHPQGKLEWPHIKAILKANETFK